MSDVISRESLCRLVDERIARGECVAGPQRVRPDLALYAKLAASGDLLLDGFIRPGNTVKDFIFPRTEKLYGYRLTGKQIELYDIEPANTPQIVIGARPCDAAALPILDAVFNWDFQDKFYNAARQRTTIVTLACLEHDGNCFCTSVGLGPDDERGSDAMLFDLGDGQYEVRCLTDKGKALFAGKTQASSRTGQVPPGPEKTIDPEDVKEFVAGNFESPQWQGMTMRCLGCGACAYNCPTCHCFDIVDEGTAAGGVRVRNWDACQYRMFTLHASGHNPRNNQGQRQRQRILHKFGMYPAKFGEILCTGCGNCTRACPVTLGVRPVLETMKRIPVEKT